jgi:hypothetical protein
MAAGDKHRICAYLKRFDDEVEVDPAGTRQPDDAHIGWVLEAGGPRQVGAHIRTPVADKGDDFRLELGSFAHTRLSTME